MEQLAACTHLENDVDVLLVVKVPVHLDDVRVIEVHLDLQFPDKLLGYLLLFQQFLLDHFERAYEV